MNPLPIDNDDAWQPWRSQFQWREGTTYLNHGSFGLPPKPVREARQQWQERLESQPMDFFFRQLEEAWLSARDRLATFVGSANDNLVFVENATVAMNVVAESFQLSPADEVLLTDHEYGAVVRIWERACQRAGAAAPKIARLPRPMETVQQVVESIVSQVNEKTRLLVISHVTSPTAITLPMAEICREAQRRDIAVCIDGPHAIAQTDLNIDALGCDFYTASLHKWLCGPAGSGFFYAAPKHHATIQPPVLSWGRLLPNRPDTWTEEFIWSGTRNPTAYLAVPAAIDFLESVGLDAFRDRTHFLAQYARQRITELTGLEPLVPDSPTWYGPMCQVPLPPGDRQTLQDALWQRWGIETPIVDWDDDRWIRVSCHLYNRQSDIDLLVDALRELLST